jgi:hypothetical protein
MACRRLPIRHGHIAARPCSSKVRHHLVLHSSPRRQNASAVAYAERVVAVHRIHNRLAVTLIVRVSNYAFARHDCA